MNINSAWKRSLLWGISEITLLLVLHAVLIRAMAQGNLASLIFTGGADLPVWSLAVVGIFIAVRLIVTLALPGIILARAGIVIWAWHSKPGN